MRDSQNIESKLLDLADDGFRAHTVEGIHKSDLHKAKNLPRKDFGVKVRGTCSGL